MVARRVVIGAVSAGVLAAGVGVPWLALRAARAEYEAAVRRTWRHAAALDDLRDPLREAVRYATLAASSHNTQCWKFALRGTSIAILPDFGRRLPVVDPDDHHLFASLGCAAENLLLAAAALGWRGEARPAEGAEALRIELEKASPSDSALFQAIPRRQSTRGLYDGKPLATDELAALQAAGTREGVELHLLTSRTALETVLGFVVQGNTAQMRDAAFVAELKQWIRFDGAQAARTGDGLFAGATGNPSLPAWLGPRLFDLAFTERAESDKYARQLRSSAGVAVFVGAQADRRHWVEVGRAYQRFALQAAALDIRTAHVNQPVEVASVRAAFASALGLGGRRPDLVVRFGRGPLLPRSVRRPVEAVLV